VGVNIETYCTRIGDFVIKYIKEYTVGVCEVVVMGN
jgi:hypothetical protein